MHEGLSPGRIALIGIMGAGKTRIGEMLAGQLGLSSIDTDSSVAQRRGRPVSQIFSEEGEAEFRRLETQALEEAVKGEGVVIACGGGIVELPRNRELLQRCTVVYLKVSPETAAIRCGNGAGRPKLRSPVATSIVALLDAREPLYERTADLTVDAEQPEDDVVQQIMQGLQL